MLSRERIAKLPRYCRNYAHETQKCLAKDGGARIICAMDGVYDPVSSSIETLKSIISYRILAAKRSERESTCHHSTPRPGTYATYVVAKWSRVCTGFRPVLTLRACKM